MCHLIIQVANVIDISEWLLNVRIQGGHRQSLDIKENNDTIQPSTIDTPWFSSLEYISPSPDY